MENALSLWQAAVAGLALVIPGVVAISKLFARVQLVEKQIEVIEPLRQSLNEVRASLARIEGALTGFNNGHQ